MDNIIPHTVVDGDDGLNVIELGLGSIGPSSFVDNVADEKQIAFLNL